MEKRFHGVLPRTGSGVPGAEGDGDGDGLACGLTAADGGDEAGVVDGPGWVPGAAFGGLAAAAGWARISESGPVTDEGLSVLLGVAVGAGVALALAAGEAVAPAAGEAAGLVPGAAAGSGVAIGFAAVGFLSASCATVNFIASVTGIRTTPLFLSTHP